MLQHFACLNYNQIRYYKRNTCEVTYLSSLCIEALDEIHKFEVVFKNSAFLSLNFKEVESKKQTS